MAPIKVMDMKYAERMADDAQVQVYSHFFPSSFPYPFLSTENGFSFLTSEGQL
jgi:hypothetical protein